MDQRSEYDWRNIAIALKMVGATSIENFNPSGTKPPE